MRANLTRGNSVTENEERSQPSIGQAYNPALLSLDPIDDFRDSVLYAMGASLDRDIHAPGCFRKALKVERREPVLFYHGNPQPDNWMEKFTTEIVKRLDTEREERIKARAFTVMGEVIETKQQLIEFAKRCTLVRNGHSRWLYVDNLILLDRWDDTPEINMGWHF